ncbi:hypothetical protein EJ03DRAFT_377478 [Teratosphaeria nubilosa]|uniref:Uncharacterized protein n=1 Tax=Teratosphaeria nubilosa TaxID=161662 RepID=A0A6G1KYU5_9PEZI|nr:hypothetical protein EJ03DRAFT_377478 [Teratosphaeria nubilosa]
MAIPPPPPGFPAGGHDFSPPRHGTPGLTEPRGRSPEPCIVISESIDVRAKQKKDGRSDTVDWALEGYSLEKAPPLPGRQASWSRVGRRQLPFDSEKLDALVKEHRQRTRTGPAHDFQQLGRRQQGVINQLIEARKLSEKNKNADWILFDVQKWQVRHFSKANETLRIQVVLKRQPKDKIKPKDSKSVSATGGYQPADIIDLYAPPKKETKDKKDKHEDVVEVLNFDLGLPENGGNHDQGRSPNQGPPPMPPPQPDPHGAPNPRAIPVDQGYPPPIQFPPQQQSPMHPFQPDPRFVNLEQFSPFMQQPEPLRARVMTRPTTPQRRRSRSARRMRQLEGEVEELKGGLRESREEFEEVRQKIDRWNLSSRGSNGSDSISTPFSGYSTSPTSLSSHSADREYYRRKQSVPYRSRSRSRDSREREERARRERREMEDSEREDRQREDRERYERDRYERARRHEGERRYGDERAGIGLAYSHVQGIDRRIRGYHPGRDAARLIPSAPRGPPVVRALAEFDDYPAGRIAEPAVLPPRRVSRRLTDRSEWTEPAVFKSAWTRRQQQARRRRDSSEDSACFV